MTGNELKKLKEACLDVTTLIHVLEREIKRLTTENKKLKKDAAKSVSADLKKENEKLKHRLDMSYGEFASEREKKAFEEFREAHVHNRRTSRIEGGMEPYIIPHGTGVGVCKTVVCQICGEKKDITDTRVW